MREMPTAKKEGNEAQVMAPWFGQELGKICEIHKKRSGSSR